MNHYRLHLLKGWAGPSTRSECQITCLHQLRWWYIEFWTIGFHDLHGYMHGFLLNEVEGPKMANRGGWIGAKKFLAKYLAAVPNSPPNTWTNQHDVHDWKNGWMFPGNTAGHHKANAKDETQNGAQTIKKRTTRFSVQALLLDMSSVPTKHVEEACWEPEQNSDS
jgi:hypothetical protein